MEGVWIKKCPCCGAYITKVEPMDKYHCGVCGWLENGFLFYCSLTNDYCTHITK